jgi:[amino group carrier protein]-L-2-aminoadipate 6-kinase
MAGPVIVVKCGGNATVSPRSVSADVAELGKHGWRVVVVHGGSSDIADLAGRLGVPARRLTSPDGVSTRYTDDAMLEVVSLALLGRTKPRLMACLANAGVAAVGLSGFDSGLLRARRKTAHRAMVDGRMRLVRDNHSGRVVAVHTGLLQALLDAGLTPVVSPPAMAQDGQPVNVDADRIAAAVAGALRADCLCLLTGAPGVLADAEDTRSLLPSCAVPIRGAPGAFGGGMGMKLIAAREALVASVPRVVVADGRVSRPVFGALAGLGTDIVLRQDQVEAG